MAALPTTITDSEAFRVARSLCEDGGPEEYLRACAEVVCDLTGEPMSQVPGVIEAMVS